MTNQTEHETIAEEPHGLEPMQYVQIGIALGIITFVELAASLWLDLGNALIPILFVLSAIKFAVVVAFFMHLRFDSGLFTRMFVGAFVLAVFVLVALISLFWTDTTDIV